MQQNEYTMDDLFDELVESGVFELEDEETEAVTVSLDYERSRRVYHDTYMDVSEDEYHRSIAEVFGLESADEAAERVDELGVSREEFVNFMALRSELEGYTADQLARMASMVTEVGPSSPVPESLEELDDETYEAFLADNDRAVVTVWMLFCEPCKAMKGDLDEVLAAIPSGVAVGGLDGEKCPEFCRDAEVNVAPAFVLFEEGEKVDEVTGRTDPEPLAERITTVLGSD